MPKGTPITFNQLKKQIVERKYKDIMPSYYDRAAKVRPNLPEYDDKALQDKLEQVVIKIAMLRLLVDDAKTKRELHQMRKSLDYNLAVRRFIKKEQRKRERRLQERALNDNIEIVEINDVDEQSPAIQEDRKPTREEYEEMEREELRQIGLDMSFSHLHIDDLVPVVVSDVDNEFVDCPVLFKPMIQVNNVQTIYDCVDHDMHFLDIMFSVDDEDYIPFESSATVSEKTTALPVISSTEPPPVDLTCGETLDEPLACGDAYRDGLIDYELAIDVRKGKPFPTNKYAERLYIGSDRSLYAIDAYNNARLLKVKNKRYVIFGLPPIDRKENRIYLSCIVGMNPYGIN